ncbi:MAG: hydroxysqualene dehydroxylase HpnE [Verrucomicrobiia bacterium]
MNTSSATSITKKSGSNLALSFSFLSAEKRNAMSVFYAFCRVVDDIADSTTLPLTEKRKQLDQWRKEIEFCYQNQNSLTLPLARELAQIIQRYSIPEIYLQEIINGVAMDLEPVIYETWEQLRQYCYRVASCVGLVSIEIFGYTNPQTKYYAELLGLAFQTTNILRDVKTDLANHRVYLPEEDFQRAGYSREELKKAHIDERALNLFRLIGERSFSLYAAAERALPPEDKPNMLAAQIMRSIYFEMLQKAQEQDYDIWHKPIAFSKMKKAWLMQRAIRQERKKVKKKKYDLAPTKKILILGGGVAGLSAAVHLTRSGHEITLIEARQTLGGRSHSFRDPKTGDNIDNGQHILMGCYHATLELLHRIGSQHLLRPETKLNVPYVSEAKPITRLQAAALPAPFHLASAIFGFQELSLSEKFRAMEVGISARLDPKGEKWRSSTAAEWLQACGQTPNAIRSLWEPFCIAALNESISTASASLFGEVIRRAFLGSREDSTILFSRVGLSQLLVRPAANIIEAAGGKILCGQAIQKIHFENALAKKVEFQNGTILEADAIISAMPWHAIRKLLPENSSLAQQISHLHGSPIIGIHLWFDQEICDEPFLGFLDSSIHWLFNKTKISDLEKTAYPSVALVISAAYEFEKTSQEELLQLALQECHRFLPKSKTAKLLHHFIYRARDATFQTRPETLSHRPDCQTPWKNFYLAGDWTNTGLPATIEGAIWSGKRAAQLLQN